VAKGAVGDPAVQVQEVWRCRSLSSTVAVMLACRLRRLVSLIGQEAGLTGQHYHGTMQHFLHLLSPLCPLDQVFHKAAKAHQAVNDLGDIRSLDPEPANRVLQPECTFCTQYSSCCFCIDAGFLALYNIEKARIWVCSTWVQEVHGPNAKSFRTSTNSMVHPSEPISL
jgi:hypothetical protein